MIKLLCITIYFFHIVISKHLRLDKGTETGDMATIHAFIRQQNGDNEEGADTVHYGPSTSNRVSHKLATITNI